LDRLFSHHREVVLFLLHRITRPSRSDFGVRAARRRFAGAASEVTLHPRARQWAAAVRPESGPRPAAASCLTQSGSKLIRSATGGAHSTEAFAGLPECGQRPSTHFVGTRGGPGTLRCHADPVRTPAVFRGPGPAELTHSIKLHALHGRRAAIE
jgi:hypothetical protein